MAHDSDAELVVAAQAGDKAAFAQLLVRHRPLLLAVCRRVLQDVALAEDAAQEAALAALFDLARLRQPERFGPWLAGIGLNVCRHWLRARRHDPASLEALSGGGWRPELALADAELGPAEAAELGELRDRVLAAVATLPAGQRAAVLLTYLGGLSQAEVATQLGIEPGAVKTRLHKGRRALRRQLQLLWEEDHMSSPSTTDWVEMRIVDVRRGKEPLAGTYAPRTVIVLQEVAGERRIGVWVGAVEGWPIVYYMENLEGTRPGTSTFIANLLELTGYKVREVRISQIVESTYYAELALAKGGEELVLDARPSDVLPLALANHAPIRIHEAVIKAVADEATARGWDLDRSIADMEGAAAWAQDMLDRANFGLRRKAS